MKIKKIKKTSGLYALKYIKPNIIIGIGSGSTSNYFINYIYMFRNMIKAAVSSSKKSTSKLKKLNIPIFNLNMIKYVDLYIDSADEVNKKMQMIKGGGGALTKEKIISINSKRFLCILDFKKKVNILGNFPLPIEIIPFSKSFIKNKIIEIGGIPKYRKNIITENGNIIIDIYNLRIKNPIKFKKKIYSLPGIVTIGLFLKKKSNINILSFKKKIKIIN
ncbi:Ribose-5-phosphate isomerase A [Candidatus Annandia adelgestsuga]|uniref:Ribose-5-phosphate isomerase A n=1 Tax=Candidatus Annandia adelgestsuga TaxID=1302411 RepID=A0A3S9J7C0_9ENTR|nr:ribose-5-phosphate isomerase RpiA [Candidatus Annandia adelgestsuga]AZP36271.1 Ribose-5-phosphate isomerase A [Candidatus Annandia adelgestsuga]